MHVNVCQCNIFIYNSIRGDYGKQLDNREVTEQDTVLLPGVSEYRKNIQDCINKLGEVLNELTVRESLDDPDTLG